MKKLLILILAVTMVLSFAACGSDDSTTDDDTAVAEYTFVIAHVDPETGPLNQYYLEFEDYVEEQTGGRMDVQVYANGVLGGDREVLEAIALGTVQMSNMASSNLSSYDPRLAIYELPFLFDSFDSAIAAYDGELGEYYNQWLADYDFLCMGVSTYGWRALSNSVREVWTPDDMEGLKIRVMEVDMYVDAFRLLGANPTPMSWNEIYTGLQQGTIDGQDNSSEQTYLARFHEVQKYYSTINHTLSNGLNICKKSYIESLPEDIQQVLWDGIAIFLEKQRATSVTNEQAYLDKMEEEGITVCYLSDEQRALFADCVAPLWEEYRELLGDEAFDVAISYSK